MTVLCAFQSFQSQAHNRLASLAYGIKDNRIYWQLRNELFPMFVCLSPGADELTPQEKEWTREAIQRWNRGFKEFLEREPEMRNMLKQRGLDKILKGPLFKESCENKKVFVKIKKTKLPGFLGRFKEGVPFKGLIEMDKRVWDRSDFINVMMHELGHVLGIPHLQHLDSDIMTSHDECEILWGEKKICELSNGDFDSFLMPYGVLREGNNQFHD